MQYITSLERIGRKKGWKEGWMNGWKTGWKEGWIEAWKEAKKETAKSLLMLGTMNHLEIAQTTGLSSEEVWQLSQELENSSDEFNPKSD